MRPAESWFKAETLFLVALILGVPSLCLLVAYLLRLTF